MSDYVWGNKQTQFFYELDYNVVLDAIERLDLRTTGRCLPLNSMENRVYEIEVINNDQEEFIVAKFYRPGRWTKEQILEEHEFMFDLQEDEIPVVAPLKIKGESLFELANEKIFFCIYPKKGGRTPQEMDVTQLEILGRSLARLHTTGAAKEAKFRLTINENTFGKQNLNYLLSKNVLPSHVASSYEKAVDELIEISAPLFSKVKNHRIHGDCHLGNIIYREEQGAFFVDFDDMLVGPAVQDIWLTTPGSDQYSKQDRLILLEAYEEIRDFDRSSLKLVEPLRALRFIHFSAWITKRWDDPAFKVAFPHFASNSYWDIQLTDLQTQLSIIKDSLLTS